MHISITCLLACGLLLFDLPSTLYIRSFSRDSNLKNTLIIGIISHHHIVIALDSWLYVYSYNTMRSIKVEGGRYSPIPTQRSSSSCELSGSFSVQCSFSARLKVNWKSQIKLSVYIIFRATCECRPPDIFTFQRNDIQQKRVYMKCGVIVWFECDIVATPFLHLESTYKLNLKLVISDSCLIHTVR